MAIKISTLLGHNTSLYLDQTPTLGASLDLNGYDIRNGTDIIQLGGTAGVSIPSGTTAEQPILPSASTLRYDTTKDSLDVFTTSDGWQSLVTSSDPRLNPYHLIRVQKNPGPGEFSTVSDALASITDNSATERYVIAVLPGIYQEANPLIMKPYVSICGFVADEVIIESLNINDHLIEACNNSVIKDVTLSGSTGSGASLVHMKDAVEDTPTLAFNVDNIRFGNSNICVLSESTAKHTNIYVFNGRFGGAYTYNQAVVALSSGGGVARINVRDSTTTGVTLPAPSDFGYASGTGAELSFISTQVRGYTTTTTGNGIRIRNGAFLRLTGTTLRNYSKGIFVENVGTASSVSINGISLASNTLDILIEHPLTTGTVLGTSNSIKTEIDSPYVSALYLDPDNAGTNSVGSLNIGISHDTLTDVTNLIQETSPMGVIRGGEITKTGTPLQIKVNAGYGYLMNTPNYRAEKMVWGDTFLTLPDESQNYIYINHAGDILYSASMPDIYSTIFLGRVRTRFNDIYFNARIPVKANNSSTHIDNYLRNAIGAIYGSGSIVTENATPLKLDVSSGMYYYSIITFTPAGGTQVPFLEYFHTAGVQSILFNQTVVRNDVYDNMTNLVPLSTGYYTKHAFFIGGDGADEEYLLIIGQDEYPNLLDAQIAPLPIPDIAFKDIVTPIAAIIVQQGNPNIVQFIDIRPRLGFTTPAISGGVKHGDLTGLTADDHTQYLLVNGTRPMSGNLNLNANNITNAAQVNGVVVQSHASRHLPNGADPITTAIASTLSASTVNTIGIENSLARSDHTHQIIGFQPLDSDLTALSNIVSNGMYVITGPGTSTTRTLTAGSTKVSVSNGTGISGNPTVDVNESNLQLNNISGVLSVLSGGTGLSTTPSNGQIDIGNGTGFTRTTLTAGQGIGITNGSGTVTISATGATAKSYHTGNVGPTVGSTIIPFDNSTPLITEGTQLWTQTITPNSLSSVFEIFFTASVDCGTNNRVVIFALYRGNTCISTTAANLPNSNRLNTLGLQFTDAPATTSAITYSLRVGVDNSATWYVNSSAGGITLNGSLASSYSITEY